MARLLILLRKAGRVITPSRQGNGGKRGNGEKGRRINLARKWNADRERTDNLTRREELK
jgi:hypothetical protein